MTGGITLWKDRGYEVEVPKSLTKEQRERYSRHLLVPEIGARGPDQAARRQGAAARRRRARLADRALPRRRRRRHARHRRRRRGRPLQPPAPGHPHDRPHRHAEGRLGRGGDRRRSTRTSNVVKYQTRLDASNIMEIIEGYDVIVDGVDNFPTRYLLNDATVRLGIPVVSASILGFDGQLSVFKPHDGPCYRCLYPVPPPAELAPSCGANGVLGVLPGTMGLLQATEVVKLSPAPASRWSAACCSTRRWARRSPSSRSAATPSARSARATRPRSPTRRWACSRTTRRSAPRPASVSPHYGHDQDPTRAAPVRGRREGGRRPPAATSAPSCARSPSSTPTTAVPAVRRRRAAQPLRQRLPQRRGRARARRPRHRRSATPTRS